MTRTINPITNIRMCKTIGTMSQTTYSRDQVRQRIQLTTRQCHHRTTLTSLKTRTTTIITTATLTTQDMLSRQARVCQTMTIIALKQHRKGPNQPTFISNKIIPMTATATPHIRV